MFTGKPLCFLYLEKLFCVNESSQSIGFSQFLKNSTAEILAPFSNITAAQANLVKVLKVESVSAIDLNQVKVTFSQEVDKTSAETITNYVLGGVDLTASDKAELQSDKKTVLINLNTAQVQYAKAAFKVKPNMIFGASSTQTVPVYETTLTFSDTVVPTVSSIMDRLQLIGQ